MDNGKAAGGIARDMRALPRTSLKKCAMLAIANGAAMEVRTADISLGGMGMIVDIALIPGQSCMVQFEAPVNSQKKQMLMRGTVAFCLPLENEEFRVGIRASHFDPDLVQYIHCLFE